MSSSTETMMKILVVEDEERQLMWLKRSLSEAGHEVRGAPDGTWALKMYRSFGAFDVIVTDSLFPGKEAMNGNLLIELIRAIDPGQPFIVQTSSESVELPRGVPLLRKPYPIGRLLRLIASARDQRLPLFDRAEPLTTR
jgi:CheY-like chemotaxis protein